MQPPNSIEKITRLPAPTLRFAEQTNKKINLKKIMVSNRLLKLEMYTSKQKKNATKMTASHIMKGTNWLGTTKIAGTRWTSKNEPQRDWLSFQAALAKMKAICIIFSLLFFHFSTFYN